jgi:hypothetical protein
MKANRLAKLVLTITLLAGAMDFCTGLLLMVDPLFTCRLMGLTQLSGLDFLPWVGAFVTAVGLSYIWGWWRGRLRFTWEFTALVRCVIGTFVTVSVARGALAPGWLPVAATDGGLALVQMVFLGKGWVVDA